MLCEDCWWYSDKRTKVCCKEQGEHSMKRVDDITYCSDYKQTIVYNPDEGGKDGD